MTATLLPPAPPLTGPPRPERRLAALDGLRALAVVGVVVFHDFGGALPGGFAGVDVFFVLSGFFITGGLLRHEGGLARFWQRRARRLLPALVLLVLVCGSLVGLIRSDAGVGFGRQVLAALGFATNWQLVSAGNSYFAQSAPPLFQHLWSLAVEEQFYLLWPLVLVALVRVARRRTQVLVVGGAALASAALMAGIALAGDTGRAYYGSDSHCFGLLAGAALALALDARPVMRLEGVRAVAAGLGGLAGLVLAFRVLDGADPLTYVLGLPAVVGLTLLLILVTVRGGLRRSLGAAPLVALGQRSYGIYLWHWPLLVLLRNAYPEAALDHPTVLGAVDVALTLAAAGASYALLERPLQRLGLGGYVRLVAARLRATGRHQPTVIAVGATAVVAAMSLTLAACMQGPRVSSAEAQIEAGMRAIQQAGYVGPVHHASAPRPHRRPSAPKPIAPTGPHITAIGDSVMLASAPGLLHRFPGISIDAQVSRQADTAPGIVASLARSGRLRPIVLIGLGTNGYLGAGTLAAIREAAGPTRELVFVNAFVPRSWEGSVDDQLRDYVARDPRSALVDWRGAISTHLGDLGPDHIHPGPAGGTLYADTVAGVLDRLHLTSAAVGHETGGVLRSDRRSWGKVPPISQRRRHRDSTRHPHR